MNTYLYFLISIIFSIHVHANEAPLKLITKDNNINYPLPSGWCDNTQSKRGLLLLQYVQAISNDSNLGLDAKLILSKCNAMSDAYPWAYVATGRMDKFSGSSQYVFNNLVKGTLNLGLLDDVLENIENTQSKISEELFEVEIQTATSSLYESSILSDDKNGITYSTDMTGFIGGKKFSELLITSATLVRSQPIWTYVYNDNTLKNANSGIIKSIIENSEVIANSNKNGTKQNSDEN